MLRAHAAMAKALDAQLEAAHGLQLSSYEVLMYLADAEDERMRMCDLASSILLSRSSLTRLVDRLAREGLLERVACSDDARGQFAKLTPAGREKLRAARATHLAGVRAMFLDLFTPRRARGARRRLGSRARRDRLGLLQVAPAARRSPLSQPARCGARRQVRHSILHGCQPRATKLDRATTQVCITQPQS